MLLLFFFPNIQDKITIKLDGTTVYEKSFKYNVLPVKK